LRGTDEGKKRYPRLGAKAMIEMSSPPWNSYLRVHRISWGNNQEEPIKERRDI
jgi:hypothetical protein